MVWPPEWPASCLLVLLYVIVVIWLTWPLAAHIKTHLPDTFFSAPADTPLIAWALAHQSRALVRSPGRLLDGNIFYPSRHALLYGETAFGAVPYFAPVYLLTGNPALALNVTLLGSVALTALALHLVVLAWTGSHLAGAASAATFLTTRWGLWSWLPCAPNYAVLQYFPLLILAAAEPWRRLARPAWLLPLVVLQGLASAYTAAAVLLPLGVLSTARLFRPCSRAAGRRLALVLGLSLVILGAVYGAHWLVRIDNPALEQQTWWPFTMETDLPWGPLSYAVPTGVPVAALLLIAVGAVLRARAGTGAPRTAWVHTAFWAIAGLLLSLSPTVVWAGREVDLPHALLAHWTPVYRVLRLTDRLGVGALMALALLAGLAFAACEARLRRALGGDGGAPRFSPLLPRAGLAAALAAAMYLECLYGPTLPVLSEVRTHTFFLKLAGSRPVPLAPHLVIRPTFVSYPLRQAIGSDSTIVRRLQAPGGPVLELPVGPGPGGSPILQARAMYRSIFYWRRPLLNGYSRYWPAGFSERMELARRLPEPNALAELRRATGLELLVVRTADLEPPERAPWLALLGAGGRADLPLLAREGDELLFRVAADAQSR